MELQQFFQEHKRAALAFSGGTDSALVLRLAHDAGVEVKPYFVKSAFQPECELADAVELATQLDIELQVLELDIFACPEAIENGPRRCYFCKRAIFSAIMEQAKEEGFDAVIDGTNASDDADDRPGMQALQELGVLSPLRLCGITKDEIRSRSKELGLFTAYKPAYACLATRVPTGKTITQEQLETVEEAEEVLFALGFTDVRVRLNGETARVQLPVEQLLVGEIMKETIRMALSPWFTDVTLEKR